MTHVKSSFTTQKECLSGNAYLCYVKRKTMHKYPLQRSICINIREYLKQYPNGRNLGVIIKDGKVSDMDIKNCIKLCLGKAQTIDLAEKNILFFDDPKSIADQGGIIICYLLNHLSVEERKELFLKGWDMI